LACPANFFALGLEAASPEPVFCQLVMSARQEGDQNQSEPSSKPMASAPLAAFRRSEVPSGPSDTRLPSLNDLFSHEFRNWSAEQAQQYPRNWTDGARGPGNRFPEVPHIAPPSSIAARGRGEGRFASEPLISSSRSHASTPPAINSKAAPSAGRLSPVPTSGTLLDARDLPSLQGPSRPEMSTYRHLQLPPGSGPSTPQQAYYPSMPSREYPSPYMPTSAQGYSPPGGSANYPVNFEPMSDYSDGKKQGRRRGNLPKQVTDILRMWFQDHVAHPYPTEEEKQQLMHQTGLSISQVGLNIIRHQLVKTDLIHRSAIGSSTRDGEVCLR